VAQCSLKLDSHFTKKTKNWLAQYFQKEKKGKEKNKLTVPRSYMSWSWYIASNQIVGVFVSNNFLLRVAWWMLGMWCQAACKNVRWLFVSCLKFCMEVNYREKKLIEAVIVGSCKFQVSIPNSQDLRNPTSTIPNGLLSLISSSSHFWY
jgi:hypothetical protein